MTKPLVPADLLKNLPVTDKPAGQSGAAKPAPRPQTQPAPKASTKPHGKSGGAAHMRSNPRGK